METYPQGSAGSGQAIRLMRHFSWKRPDQIRLAKHYLASIPFANKEGYEVFLSFMSVSRTLSTKSGEIQGLTLPIYDSTYNSWPISPLATEATF